MHKVQYTGKSKILIRLCEAVNDLIDRGAGNVEDLADVEITNLADNQILKYNSASEKWINANDAGGVDEFADLEDVNLTNLQNGQVPKYNATTHKWENANESGGGSNVSITPTLSSGTKIADFEIDGTAGSLYAPNGGGGGTGGYKQTELFTSATPVNSGTLNLSDDISNYDVLCFEYALVGSYGSGDNSLSYKYIDASYFMETFPNTATRETDHLIIDGYDNFYLYAKMGNADDKIDVWNVGSPNTGVLKVFGIKYGAGGGQGGEQVVDLIYEASSTSIVDVTTIKSMTDYDYIIIEADERGGTYINTCILLKEEVEDAITNGKTVTPVYLNDNYRIYCTIDDNITITLTDARNMYIRKVYGVKSGSGSGGTEVIANPSEEPTDTLTTIKIGDTVYDIEGAEGSGYESTLIYDGSALSSLQSSIELDDRWDNYDALYLTFKFAGDGSTFGGLILKEQLLEALNHTYMAIGSYTQNYVGAHIVNDYKTFNQIYGGGNYQQNIYAVYGLKFGAGGSSGGSGYEETDLWTGSGNMFNSLSITLDDAYTNYDALRFEYQSVRADAQTVPVHYEKYVSKETLETSNRFSISDFYLWNNVGVNVSGSFTDATHLTTYLEAYSWFSSCTLTKIVGIKYGSGGGGGSSLPFDVVIDSNDNGINLIYEYDDGQ